MDEPFEKPQTEGHLEGELPPVEVYNPTLDDVGWETESYDEYIGED